MRALIECSASGMRVCASAAWKAAKCQILREVALGVELQQLVAELHDSAAQRLTRELARRQTDEEIAWTYADEKALGRHVIGEVLADLAQSGETRHDIDLLRLHRFSEKLISVS